MLDGLVGIQHVSSTVRDLDETLAWYRDVLGVEPFMTMQAEGPELSAGHVAPVPSTRPAKGPGRCHVFGAR